MRESLLRAMAPLLAVLLLQLLAPRADSQHVVLQPPKPVDDDGTVRVPPDSLLPQACAERRGGCRYTAKGWWPSECVHNVPTGAAVRALRRGLEPAGVEVTYPNGTRTVMAECAAARQFAAALLHDGVGSSGLHARQFGAYPIMWEYGIDPKEAPMDHWSGVYHVGKHPANGSGGSFWVGLEPYTCDSVMQAVTYFTNSGWFVVSENCCPGGHDFRVGEVKVNDTSAPIYGSVTRLASLPLVGGGGHGCSPNASVKMSTCNRGQTLKAPGSGTGSLLPADCAKICESNKFESLLGSECMGGAAEGERPQRNCAHSSAAAVPKVQPLSR